MTRHLDLTTVHRGARRVANRVRRAVSDGAVAGTPAARAGHVAARQEATRLWNQGGRAASTEVLRRALSVHGHDAMTWYVYGARLMQQNRADVAFEAMKFAVELDPCNVAAIELLVELADVSAHGDGHVTEALAGLERGILGRPRNHRDALTFLVPAHSPAVESIAVHSTDEVARLTARLCTRGKGEWDACLADASPSVAREARVRALLARGSNSAAVELLATLEPSAIPQFALRLAVRAALRRNRTAAAQALLGQYLRANPGDGWALSKERSLREGPKELTNYQLGVVGYPFRKAAKRAAYEPRRDRVLYALHNSLPHHSAGYATRTHGLLSALATSGWDISGVTRLGYPYDMPGHENDGVIPARDEVDNVSYLRLSTTPGIERKSPIQRYVKRYSRALAELATTERPLVLHAASNHWNGLTAVTTARKLGIASIYEVRGLWEVTRGSRDPEWAEGGMYRFMARMESDAAANATRVIAITDALKRELIERGVDEEKIILVPNGVDTERFRPRPENSGLGARLGIGGKKVIGYVGSVLDYEGLGLLIDAAAQLRRERDDFVVLIVGDGAEREAFESRVAREGLADVVRFTGRVPHSEVEDYYSLIQICPFPRLPLPVCEMVSPLKPFEALAVGKTVIASDVAAMAEIVNDGVTGLLHRKGDVVDLTRQLRRALDDPGLVDRLAHQGRAWVERNRRWDVLADRISALYEELGGVRLSGATTAPR